MVKQLIVEVFKNTGLKELTDIANVPDGMMMIEGVLGCVDKVNRNKRFYPREEYSKHIELMQSRIAESNGILGEMEHPKSMNIDLNNVSHKVMSIRLDEDGFVRGRVLLLDTPKGKIAQSIVRSGTPLPISSRAIGRVQEDGSVKLDYMSTYDLVGTSGFAEANMTASVFESLDEAGNHLSETFAYTLDDKGDAISESTLANIVEVVTETLKKSFVHIDDVQAIVENRVAALTPTVQQTISESLETEQSVTNESVIALMNDRFANVYSPIIENWMTSEFSPSFGNIIQEWLVNEHAPTMQAWIVEDVLPANAALTESWMKTEFAPSFGQMIQEWLTTDYSNSLVESLKAQNVIVTEAATIADETIPTPAVDALDDEGQKIVEVPDTAEPVTIVAPIVEAASKFKSKLLESSAALIAEARELKANTSTAIVENVQDNSEFATGPTWLKLIPEEYKTVWSSLNESHRADVYRRAAVRIMESTGDVKRFWNGINFQDIVAKNLPPMSRTQFLAEDAQPAFNGRESIVQMSKHLKT